MSSEQISFVRYQTTIPLLIVTVVFQCSATHSTLKNSVSESQPNPKLTINVYYEALCPASCDFLVNELCPLWEKFKGQYFNVDLVPYGNAQTYVNKSSGHCRIDCQHGPQECLENTMHACALKHLSFKNSIKLICCCLTSRKGGNCPDCAKRLGIDYKPVEGCVQTSDEGFKLHYAAGERTSSLKPRHKSVPWILFNGRFNKKIMNQAWGDLESTVCRYLDVLDTSKPESCSDYYFETRIVRQSNH